MNIETFDATVLDYKASNNSKWGTVKVSSYSFKKELPGSLFIRVGGDNDGKLNPVCIGYVSGNDLPTTVGAKVTFSVEVVNRGGKSFYNCITYTWKTPKNQKEIKSYLNAVLGKTKLLSRAMISRLVDEKGSNTLNLFKKETLKELFPYFCPKGYEHGDDFERLEKAVETVNSNKDITNELYRELAEFGIGREIAKRLIDNGIEDLCQIEEDPYQCLEINGIGIKTVEKLANAFDGDPHDARRIIAVTKAVVDALENSKGHLYVSSTEVFEGTKKQLVALDGVRGINTKYESSEWIKIINNDIKSKNPTFFAFNNQIMLASDNDNETNSSKKLAALCSQKSQYDRNYILALANNMNKTEANKRGFMLSQEQIEAVVNAVCSKVSIITGGPGTGKSTILDMILKIWKQITMMPITCMAPTGKAASRMSEVTGVPAHTIHKAVRIIPSDDETQHDSLAQLEKGLIVIDESSMIDMSTLTKLLSCIPVGSTVLFLGDIDQLPSVGKGDVLNQMIQSGLINISKLTATMRQANGSPIIYNATKINHCQTDLNWNTPDFQLVNGSDKDVEKLKELYAKKVAQYGVEQVAVLAPLRKRNKQRNFNMVSDNLNTILREVVNPKSEDKKEIKIATKDDKNFFYRQGDRIMSWKNHGEIANGDIGVIDKIYEDEFHQWQFDISWENGQKTTYGVDEMQSCSLAYAMSIHKSQGSEYKCVIMPILLEQWGTICSKNLLYTGVTRAKKEVTIFGDLNAVNKTIRNNSATKRNSYLSARLQKRAQLLGISK